MAEPRKMNIDVSAKVIADISIGLYRTPANALKELISNSWDADASLVTINTDYPNFAKFTCSDNGGGMNVQKFIKVMSSIGGSSKRIEGKSEKTKSGRLKIGKIGIGLLAVTQICKKFRVISSTGNGKKFEAEIDMKPFLKEDIYNKKLNSTDEKINIGAYYIYEDLPEEKDKSYTSIILEEIDTGFRNRLLEETNPDHILPPEEFKIIKEDPKSFEKFVEWISKHQRIRDLNEYTRMLWELALLSPVKYLEDGPVKNEIVIPDIKKRLANSNFRVYVDGLELKKPILFPLDKSIVHKGNDYKVYRFSYDEKKESKTLLIKNNPLKFKCYIYHQRTRINPPEYRGILIRIRNIGIDYFDKSLLNYPKNIGPRIAGVSGEIYVESGLEESLNIDRNSFRESDPHFIKLQTLIYDFLGKPKGVIADITKRSKIRMDSVRHELKRENDTDFENKIKHLLGTKYSISRRHEIKPIPVKIDHKNKKIILYKNPIFPRKEERKRLIEKIIILFYIANSISKNRNELNDNFIKFLREISDDY